jgi:hypothetical protein
MNKLTAEKCRLQFEAWWESFNETTPRDSWSVLYSPEHDCYVDGEIDGQYDAWKASRKALEIALPVLEQEGGWISCSERLPESTAETWSKDVIALSDTGDVFRLACQGSYWQRTKAFIQSGSEKVTHWQPLPQPPSAPQIDNDGWVEWNGASDPCDDTIGGFVEVKFRCGVTDNGRASKWYWKHDNCALDIIAYRVIENDGREG